MIDLSKMEPWNPLDVDPDSTIVAAVPAESLVVGDWLTNTDHPVWRIEHVVRRIPIFAQGALGRRRAGHHRLQLVIAWIDPNDRSDHLELVDTQHVFRFGETVSLTHRGT